MVGFDRVLTEEWMPQMEADRVVEQHLLQQLANAPPDSPEAETILQQLQKFNSERFPGYALVGDNVDIRLQRR